MAHSIFKQTQHTILLVTRLNIARIDLIGRRKLKVDRLWFEQRNEIDSLENSLTRAAELGPRPIGRLTVLHSDFWTEILQLPTDVASIATPQELRNALALEAETESGYVAFECDVASLQLKSQETVDVPFCATLVEKSRLAELNRFAKDQRAKLYCVAHPAAFKLTQHTTYQDAVIELGRWASDPSGFGSFVERLAADICEYFHQHKQQPTLSICSEPTDLKKPAFAIGLAVASLSGCMLWNLDTRHRILTIAGSIQSVEELDHQQTQLATNLKTAESKLVSLTQETDSAIANRRSIEIQLQAATELERIQNSRWTELLAAISQNADDCWVQEIDSDVHKTTIRGLAISNAEANQFAARMEQALKSAGWTISPAATKLTGTGLFQFSIIAKPTIEIPRVRTTSNEIASNHPISTPAKESFP